MQDKSYVPVSCPVQIRIILCFCRKLRHGGNRGPYFSSYKGDKGFDHCLSCRFFQFFLDDPREIMISSLMITMISTDLRLLFRL